MRKHFDISVVLLSDQHQPSPNHYELFFQFSILLELLQEY